MSFSFDPFGLSSYRGVKIQPFTFTLHLLGIRTHLRIVNQMFKCQECQVAETLDACVQLDSGVRGGSILRWTLWFIQEGKLQRIMVELSLIHI